MPNERNPDTRSPRLSHAMLADLGALLGDALAPSSTGEIPVAVSEALDRLASAVAARDDRAARAIQGQLVEAMPALRRFAFSLTRDEARSDDLVQDTLVRAWSKAASFQEGTNLNAWLFTILRNTFYSDARKRRREVEDAEGEHAGRLATLPDQDVRIEVGELRSAMRRLPIAQREALLLVGAQNFTYDEAAEICGVPVGTMKSRVSRARSALVGWLGMSAAHDIGADPVTRAAMTAG